jgi:hypothetical protein
VRAVTAAASYAALTLVMTWPLAGGLSSDLPWDLGDPLLNCWIIAWNCRQWMRLLTGDVSALADIWHGNIFHPAPYVLGYSELLFSQSLMALPVYALTHNVILCYNLVFLSTFTLSGLGTYLLVRDLTGDWRAAFLAGLLFAFAPYRLHQATHLQVMSSQWMPFILLGLRRFAATGRVWPLAWSGLAYIAQNLACGYYLFFFSPFVAAYAAFELWLHVRLRDRRAWMAVAVMAVTVAAITAACMYPYLALREIGQRARGLSEVAKFSADVYAYATADPNLRIWGWLQTWPRPEGHLFPGLAAIVLACAGAFVALRSCVRSVPPETADEANAPTRSRAKRLRRWLVTLAVIVAVGHLVAVFVLLAGGEGRYSLGPFSVTLFSLARPFWTAVLSTLGVLALSPRARSVAGCVSRSPALFACAAAFVAAWLSFGPTVRVLGDSLRDASIYEWLYFYVPGVDALRVPARFAMINALFLSVAAGFGLRSLLSGRGWVMFWALCVFVLVDGLVAPVPLNGVSPTKRTLPPPAHQSPGPTPLDRAIGALPADAVLVELPFGEIGWELRYVFSSTFHWRRILNGYSGDFPASYVTIREALDELPEEGGDRAWSVMRDAGATHAVVHEAAFGPERAASMRAWLETRRARLVQRVPGGWIYELAPGTTQRTRQP